MKIAMVKQECNDGDKVTVAGTVRWIGKEEVHEGQDGQFATQSVLLVDGPQTDDRCNSIFCQFSADAGSWNHLKDKKTTIQGTINIYDGKMSLRSCKVKEAPQASQQAPQTPAGGQKPRPAEDTTQRLIVAQVAAYCVKDLIIAKVLIYNDKIGQAIADWTYWIMMAGQNIPLPNKEITQDSQTLEQKYGIPPEDPRDPQPGDDIPF